VVALLLYKAIGGRLRCIFVNNDSEEKRSFQVVNLFRYHFEIPLIYVNARKTLPEKIGRSSTRRQTKRIGKEFISVFEKESKKIGRVKYLAQGTLYPDVIESLSSKGPSATIQEPPQCGGLPEKMKLKLIEPFENYLKTK